MRLDLPHSSSAQENCRDLATLSPAASANQQIWIAVSVYVLVAIVRKRLGLDMSLYQILQIFSITLLEKMPISCVIAAFDSHSELLDNSNQLILFDI
jgi:hypothetical protein